MYVAFRPDPPIVDHCHVVGCLSTSTWAYVLHIIFQLLVRYSSLTSGEVSSIIQISNVELDNGAESGFQNSASFIRQ
jgi:hypothetical protein